MSDYKQILMQYETALPDDQTMEEVRNRAISIAPKFDEYPGLNFKLYGVNERSEAAVNEYSSIYLWSDLESMRGFLEGDLFDNYSRGLCPAKRSIMVDSRNDRRSSRTERSPLLFTANHPVAAPSENRRIPKGLDGTSISSRSSLSHCRI